MDFIVCPYNGAFPNPTSVLVNKKLSDYCVVQSSTNQMALSIFETTIKTTLDQCFLSGNTRRFLSVQFGEKIKLIPKERSFFDTLMSVKVTLTNINEKSIVIPDELTHTFQESLQSCVITKNGIMTLKSGTMLQCNFSDLKTLDNSDASYGIVDVTTQIILSDGIQIINGSHQKMVFKGEFRLVDQGIGGLSKEFEEMFRRVFATRVLDPKQIEEMDIKHIKGIVLYGPPGCGKTLIARQIGNMLNCKETKVVNGPELLNKYVGESEANTRNLFANAMKDKNPQNLYLIVLDEMDALCKTRSSEDHTGASTGVVNTLL